MRRADRLFLLIQYLRARPLTTAAWLAEKLEVSKRTVYRDVQDLILSGLPIEGEPGMGYALRRSLDLPPLHFTRDEVAAVELGLRFVLGRTTPKLKRAASSAHAKIVSVCPADVLASARREVALVPVRTGATERWLQEVSEAVGARRRLAVVYRSEDGAQTERTLRPLAVFYWGRAWTLTAWCEMRHGFRSFRLERFERLQALDATFDDEPGKRLEDYLRQMQDDHGVPIAVMNPELT